MDALTYRTILRTYADMLRAGTTDTDMSPRQRRLAAIILATASNDGRADRPYRDATDDIRTGIIATMTARSWDANVRPLFDAYGPTAAADYDAAHVRAIDIIRNA